MGETGTWNEGQGVTCLGKGIWPGILWGPFLYWGIIIGKH